MKNKVYLSKKSALLIIFGSSFFLVTAFLISWYCYHALCQHRLVDPRYNIVAIVQKSASGDIIPTKYLAELLNLSYDKPTNLYAFHTKRAKKILEASRLFEEAVLQTVPPGVVVVNYTLRKPLALLADYENIAIDSKQVLFPLFPFLRPKWLPEIYLGNRNLEALNFAIEALQEMTPLLPSTLFIERLDVSNAFSKSACKEIVLLLQDRKESGAKQYLVRLPHKEYTQRLEHLVKLLPTLQSLRIGEPQVVDLRIEQVALVK